MLMASALMNSCVGGGSTHHGYMRKRLGWNHNVIKGKQFLPRERIASTSWQITRSIHENSNNHFQPRKTKWWEIDTKSNMKIITTQQDLDDQLLMAGDNLTVVHFFSPSCPGCKALHPKVHQYAGMHPELQFLLINCDEHREIGQSHHVHVLPMFHFYRGAEGHICSFSCTITTIHKFKNALKRHGVQIEKSPAAEDASPNIDEDDDPITPSNE